MDDLSRRAQEDALPEWAMRARFDNGLCISCGTQIYNVNAAAEDTNNLMVPLTKEGTVNHGRCLYCYPWKQEEEDPAMEASTLPPSEISVPAADEAAGNTERQASSNDNSSPTVIAIKSFKGKIYHGLVMEGTAEKGKGVFVRKVQKGEFKGKAHVYDGEFEGGFFEGHGIFHYASSDVYEGEFKKGGRDGHGKYIWSNGAIYEGDWKNDSRHGKGTYTWTNGEVYEGEWKNDERDGMGEVRYAS